MAYKVHWLHRAEVDFDSIYLFYSQMASESVAKRRVSKILDAIDAIGYMPTIGHLDEEYHHTPTYRYLTVLDYKVYYFVEDEVVFVAALWDCRQGGKIFGNNS